MGREDEGSDLWEWETPRGLFLCLVLYVGISHPVSAQRTFECPFPSSGEGIGRSLGVVVKEELLQLFYRGIAVFRLPQ